MKTEKRIPMKLQLFAEGGNGNEDTTGNQNTQAAGQQAPSIDYEKLAAIIEGKQKVTEETVIKNYFKQQGLSDAEMAQAISTFKAEKVKNTPDVVALQNELKNAKAEVQRAKIEQQATTEALTLGIDVKTVPYLLKLADFNGVIGEDGTINTETLKNALNKVLEDVPQFKPNTEQSSGFRIGGSSGNKDNNDSSLDALKNAFGLK